MRQTRLKRFWLCRHGHPMWRKPVTGHWICHTCNELNLNHAKEEMGYCIHGHKRVVGRECPVCRTYTSTGWLKQLDETGESECSNGHPVSHHDNSIMYSKTKKQKARYCRRCQVGSIKKARTLMPDFTANPMCRRGLHPRTEENTRWVKGKRQCRPCWIESHKKYLLRTEVKREKKSGLKARYVDWVVVERLLARGQMDYIKRGTHRGPTDAERWIAYCTFRANNQGRHPEEMYGEPGYDAMTLWKLSAWKDIGRKYNWREFTLYDLMSIIHTPKYVSGGFLDKYKNKENPRD